MFTTSHDDDRQTGTDQQEEVLGLLPADLQLLVHGLRLRVQGLLQEVFRVQLRKAPPQR